MTLERTLLLLRHAQAADGISGLRDHERPLTDHGLQQATEVGNAIRTKGLTVDLTLCSAAARTRQTWEALALDSRCEFTDEIYNAGSDTLLELIQHLDESVGTAMIIGHGPGLPALAARLSGPGSDQPSLDLINSRFPTATLAAVAVEGLWSDLNAGRLTWVRLGSH